MAERAENKTGGAALDHGVAVGSALDIDTSLAEPLSSWLGSVGERLDKAPPPGRVGHVGRLVRIGDGVATVTGLPDARYNELLRFPGDVYGFVFNLDPGRIGCVILGDDFHLRAGDSVRQTGRVVSVPVGEALLGRVVDALGRPLDGRGPVKAARRDPVEKEAPPILHRRAVVEQLVTGTKAIDALIPIGRGQRELIVGDRATGKSALAVDAVIRQVDSDVVCVYAAIGQKAASVRRAVEPFREHGIIDRTIVVSADADDAAGLKFIAPYAAMTMAEYFMRKGRDTLVILDDMTRHARAYREISLLLRRPPGREAYPGDIFFVHSRLLERSTRLTEAQGGGSLTALPIVETQAKNIAAYIPTNLVSITDGQIFLDPDLFYKGVKPAIDIGKSVSRVGGKTQLPAIRAVAKKLRLEYAQFLELEIFTRFGATVEQETRRKIERGRRIREILKQGRLDPLSAGEQAVILLAVDRGAIDRVPIERLSAYQRDLRRKAAERQEIMKRIDSGAELSDKEWDTLAGSCWEAARRHIGDTAE